MAKLQIVNVSVVINKQTKNEQNWLHSVKLN